MKGPLGYVQIQVGNGLCDIEDAFYWRFFMGEPLLMKTIAQMTYLKVAVSLYEKLRPIGWATARLFRMLEA